MARDSIRRRYWLAGNREPGQDEFFEEALDKSLWRRGTERNWDTCWYTGMPDADVFERLGPTRSINHIPGNNALTIKSYLWKTLSTARRRLAGRPQAARMDFFPRTWVMPEDYRALQIAAASEPDRLWLRKPVNSSRGRGVGLIEDVAAAPRGEEWMIQEYLARPHLYEGRKYVLRLYVLISSVEPLRAHVYHEGFMKLASEPFDLADTGNVFAHLTNPDINAENDRVEAPVVFIGLHRYREWLRREGHDDTALFARIDDLLSLSVIAAREPMRRRLSVHGNDTHGAYELLGIDCMIDADLKPWILECNLSPSLEVCSAPEDGGIFERETKRQLVFDMVALLGLNERPDMARQTLSPEAHIARDHDREMASSGGFRLLCPTTDPLDYLTAFPAPRQADIALMAHIHGSVPDLHFEPGDIGEIFEDDRLALYDAASGRLFHPNEMASLIWLSMAEGMSANAIAEDLAGRSADPWRTKSEVWALFDEWARDGFVRLKGTSSAGDLRLQSNGRVLRPAGIDLQCGGQIIRLEWNCPGAEARLAPLFAPLACKPAKEIPDRHEIALMPSPTGYAVALDRALLTGPRGLDWIATQLWQMLFELAPGPGGLAIKGQILPLADGSGLFLPSLPEGGYDRLGRMLEGDHGAALLALAGDGRMSAIGLPSRIGGDGEFGAMLPAGPSLPGPCAIAAVLLPGRGDATLREMSAAAMLAALLPALSAEAGAKPAGQTIEALCDWLGERPLFYVGTDDPDAAKAAVQARWRLRTA